MDINDNKRHDVSKVFIDFGTIEDHEYDILCMTAFGMQGRPHASNFTYEEVSNEDGVRLFKRERVSAAFEFPSNEWCDVWLKELALYLAPKKTRKKSVTRKKPVKETAAI